MHTMRPGPCSQGGAGLQMISCDDQAAEEEEEEEGGEQWGQISQCGPGSGGDHSVGH